MVFEVSFNQKLVNKKYYDNKHCKVDILNITQLTFACSMSKNRGT